MGTQSQMYGGCHFGKVVYFIIASPSCPPPAPSSGGDGSGGAWGSAGGGAGFAAGAGEAAGGGWGEKHWQRASSKSSSKAGAGSKRWSQQAAITAVEITSAPRGVAQAMAQALQRGQKTQWGEGVGEKHWQRVSSKAGAGSKRRSQQVAIKAVAITAAARGVTQAMAQAL